MSTNSYSTWVGYGPTLQRGGVTLSWRHVIIPANNANRCLSKLSISLWILLIFGDYPDSLPTNNRILVCTDYFEIVPIEVKWPRRNSVELRSVRKQPGRSSCTKILCHYLLSIGPVMFSGYMFLKWKLSYRTWNHWHRLWWSKLLLVLNYSIGLGLHLCINYYWSKN